MNLSKLLCRAERSDETDMTPGMVPDRRWTRLKSQTLLSTVALLVMIVCTCCAQKSFADTGAAGKPNILLLLSDDHRADAIGAFGNSSIRTPHLDRLIRNGFAFRRAYIFGGNSGAVCVPSRAMLMTGKHWLHTKTNDLNGEYLLPEHLRSLGYNTFHTGKWHNGESSWLRAFDQGDTLFFGGMSDHTKVPLKKLDAGRKLTPLPASEGFSSELFANSMIRFLEKQRDGEPFFAYAAFTAPHDPRQPPTPERDHYYKNRPPLPKNFMPQHPFDNGMMSNLRDENLAAWPRDPQVLSDQIAEYYGMIEHLDGQIGRILDTLRTTGLDKNTIVVFAADNGLALGSHGLLGKQSVYEHSMHVPLVVSGPGISAGESQSFCYLMDLFPTLCELIHAEPPKNGDGKSLVGILKSPNHKVREDVFLPFLDIQRAVVEDRWKLIVYPKIQHMQLFDLQEDPDELVNKIDDPSCAPHVARLLKRMKSWQEEVGDRIELPAVSKPAPPISLSGNPRKPDQWQPEWIVEKYFQPSK